MKTNYLPRNKSRQGYWRRAGYIIGVFAVLFIVFTFLGPLLSRAAQPLWKSENIIGRALVRQAEYWRTKSALIAENAELRDTVAALDAERVSQNLALAQRDSLKTLIGRDLARGEIVAAVLTWPPQSPYDTIIIDAGSKDGVTSGAQVALSQGAALGVVSDVTATTAKVKLFSSPDERVSAVLERFEVPILLEGVGGGTLRASVPRETEVVVGDRILSADLHNSLLGIVESVHVGATDAFKEVLARSPANIFSLRLVIISTN